MIVPQKKPSRKSHNLLAQRNLRKNHLPNEHQINHEINLLRSAARMRRIIHNRMQA